MTKIVATKKLPKALKAKLSDAGIELVEKNFIQTQSIPFETPQLNDYLIFTSKEAIKSILKSDVKDVLSKYCFCVGSKTRSFLEKKGFTVIESADYAENLIQIIEAKYSNNSFTFFCGNIRRNTIPDFFQQNKIAYNEIVVYETKLKPHQIKEPFDGILFFSPSGVNSFLEKNSLENKTCFCIGTTTAKALENKTKNIIITDKPLVENVIKEVLKYYKN